MIVVAGKQMMLPKPNCPNRRPAESNGPIAPALQTCRQPARTQVLARSRTPLRALFTSILIRLSGFIRGLPCESVSGFGIPAAKPEQST
jgi:hypothetical protein